jgi:hypothetical protein
MTKSLFGLGKKRPHLIGLGHIGGDHKHFFPRRLPHASGLFEFRRAPPGQYHRESRGLQRDAGSAPDTSAGAGHYRYFRSIYRRMRSLVSWIAYIWARKFCQIRAQVGNFGRLALASRRRYTRKIPISTLAKVIFFTFCATIQPGR